MHETNDYRLKADYYRKTLETERANREQADNQVIDLLHDIKSRYETKLSGYMAKNKNKKREDKNDNSNSKETSAPAANDWGTSTTDNQQTSGWGDTNNSNQDAQQTSCWDTNDNNQDTQQSSSWDTNDNNQTSQPTEDWGATDQTSKPTDDWNTQPTTTANDWGTEPAKPAENDWGASPPKKASPEKGNSKKNSKPESGGKESGKNKNKKNDKKDDNSKETPAADGWGTSTTDNQQSSSWDTNDTSKNTQQTSSWDKNDTSKSTQQTSSWDTKDDKQGNQAAKPTNSWGTTTPKKTGPAKGNPVKTNKADSSAKECGDPKSGEKGETGSKEFLDMKSQLWTAKLDLRLLERDKAKLGEEISELKTERDNLTRKLEHATQELEKLKMKVRGTTIDLVAANEEINKLNERIDEIEGERRNRDNDITMSESRRRAMENKYKMFQQQIADLQSESNLLKEERDEYKMRFHDVHKRNERLEADLQHSKSLIRTLKDGCAFVENQAKTFEVRHDTVMMSKADLERELIAIKEESSRHITTINKLQKSNEQISKAFIQSVEAHDQCKKESEFMHQEYDRRLEAANIENHRLVEANTQLRKLIDYLQKNKKRG